MQSSSCCFRPRRRFRRSRVSRCTSRRTRPTQRPTPRPSRSASRSGRPTWCRRSTAITGRSTSWSAWTSRGRSPASSSTYDSEPYGYFSVEPPKFAAQFKGKTHPRSVQGRRGRRRGFARVDQHRQRHARDSRQLTHGARNAARRISGEVGSETGRNLGGTSCGPQALDLALLVGFIALALVGFFRKSVRLKYVDARGRRSATWDSARAS